MRKIYTSHDIEVVQATGQKEIVLTDNDIVTSEARDRAQSVGVRLLSQAEAATREPAAARKPSPPALFHTAEVAPRSQAAKSQLDEGLVEQLVQKSVDKYLQRQKSQSTMSSSTSTPQPDHEVDLVLRNGNLLIPGVGLVPGDIEIAQGKILGISARSSLRGSKELDVAGKIVLPGIIDPHIHLGIFGSFEEELITETKSALLGGVTTAGVFLGGQESYCRTLDRMERLVHKSHIDLFPHLVIMTPEQQKEIPKYYEHYGVTSFKLYMSGIPGLIPDVDDGFILETLEIVRECTSKGVVCIHAENTHLIDHFSGKVRASVANGTLADWADTHPNYAEEEAVVRAAFLAKTAKTPVYIVHVSAGNSAKALREIKHTNPYVYAETTSPYLTVDRFSTKGLVAKMVPPFRDPLDLDLLWESVLDGTIDTIATDNVTMTLREKNQDGGMWGAMPGYPALATHLPAILHYGVNQRGHDLLKVLEKMTANPAKIFGIYPRKGALLPGSDADLVVIDLHQEKQVKCQELFSRSDFSLYDGERLQGWPLITIKGGKVAVIDGQLTGEALPGKLLKR